MATTAGGRRSQPELHCTENPTYVFPEMKLQGRIPNSYIQVSVRDLYIPRIGLHIWLQQKSRLIQDKSLTDT
jgi:hypothetical protein